MKKYIEYIILGAVALACLLYIGLRDTSEINYKLPSFRLISRDSFTKIEITKGTETGDTILLEKDTDGWTLTEGSFPADSGKINKLLDAVEEIVPMDLVSQSENYGRYDLDDSIKITLKAWNGERLVREIHYGKLSSSRNYNYVLFPGDKNVYTLRGNMKDTLDSNAEDFRSKTVLQLNRNDVIKIAFESPEISRTISKGAGDLWTDETGNELDVQTVNGILGNLSSLKCKSFLNAPPAGDSYSFRITGTKEYTLSLFEKTDEGYPGMTSYHSHPFIITAYTGDALLDAFLPEEDSDKEALGTE